MPAPYSTSSFFFFNDTATTEIYTLSLHDALPIWSGVREDRRPGVLRAPRLPGFGERDGSARLYSRSTGPGRGGFSGFRCFVFALPGRSEEHTSELQSLTNLVCRLLLEKKNNQQTAVQQVRHMETVYDFIATLRARRHLCEPARALTH